MKKVFKRILNSLRGEQSIEKLKKRGLKVGRNFKNIGQSIIDPSHCWHIEIGNDVTFAPRVHILAHDASTKLYLNYTRIANVKIGDRVFLGAGTIVMPGVTIGNDVIVGAGSLVLKDIDSNSVVGGVPARFICNLNDYIRKEKAKMTELNTFGDDFTLRFGDLSLEKKMQMKNACDLNGEAFVS